MKQTNIYSHKGWLKDITIREYPYSSAGEIAARHGVCSGSVWYWVKKLGLQQTDETKARILKKTRGGYRKHNQDKSRGQTKKHGNEKAHMDDGAIPRNVGAASENKDAHCDATHQGVQGNLVPGEYAQLLSRHRGGRQVYALLRRRDETLRQGVLLRTTTWTHIQKSIVFCTLLYFLLKNELLKDNSRVRTPIFDFTWLLRRLRSSNEVVV